MSYTETRNINGKKYYYRVLSVRKGKKISKKRVYLGHDLSNSELLIKEKMADEKLLSKKIKKTNKEIERIKPKIIKILKRNNVSRAGIFGSYARGEQGENSDVDIVVDIEDKRMSLLGFIKLIRLFIEDILESIKNIREFVKGLNREKFSKDNLRQSAVIRQLEIIGEAVKNIPSSFREKYPNIPWKDIAGFRDVLNHAYFGVNIDRVWNIIERDLTKLKKKIEKIKF